MNSGQKCIEAEAQHLKCTNSFHNVTHPESALHDLDWQDELCHGISRIIWQPMPWLKGDVFTHL